MTIHDRISDSYANLSDKLKVAAKFVEENPVDVATRSLRSVAETSGVSPATFSRLARALGYDDYDAMREEGRMSVERKMATFSERASSLRARATGQGGSDMLQNQAAACVANIEALLDTIGSKKLERAVGALHDAETVLLVGSMGSAGLVDYFGYMNQWFKSSWRVAGRNGTELATALSRLTYDDTVFALVKTPYARRTVASLQAARAKGVTTVVLTDSVTSPALEFADHPLVVATEGPQFFSSYAATIVIMETIVSMLLAKAGPEAEEMIRAAELQINRLGDNWT